MNKSTDNDWSQCILYFAKYNHWIVWVKSDQPYKTDPYLTQLLRIILARVTKATPDGGDAYAIVYYREKT